MLRILVSFLVVLAHVTGQTTCGAVKTLYQSGPCCGSDASVSVASEIRFVGSKRISQYNAADAALKSVDETFTFETFTFTRQPWATTTAPADAVGTWEGFNLNQSGVANSPDRLVINADGTTSWWSPDGSGGWVRYFSHSRLVHVETVGTRIYMIEDASAGGAGGASSYIVTHLNNDLGATTTIAEYVESWFFVHVVDTASNPMSLEFVIAIDGLVSSDWAGYTAAVSGLSFDSTTVNQAQGSAAYKKMPGAYSKSSVIPFSR